MNFEKYFRLSSTLLILTGFTSILITGSYLVSVSIGILITLINAFFGEIHRSIPLPKNFWNAIALFLVAYLVYDSFWASRDLIGNGVRFVVYLQIVKLLSPKTPRDEMQIYLLSFLHLLASTSISTDVSFALPFLIYILLATWTLTMFTLRNQLLQTTEESRRSAILSNLLMSKDVMTRNFFGLTSALALSVVTITMGIFFSFPRLSMGNFLKRIDTRQKVSGFSDSVELGTIGNIKLNNKIVFRAEFPLETIKDLNPDQFYWRGTASDFFDGRRWKQSFESRQSINLDLDSGVVSIERKQYPEGKRISYHVFMEALDPPILFSIDNLLRITWDKPMVEKFFRRAMTLTQDEYDGLHFAGYSSYVADLTYQAESILSTQKLNLPTDKKIRWRPYVQDYYLQLPTLEPDVREWIQKIPIPQNATLFETANALVSFIEKNYEYTLDVQDAGTLDPLRFFFIEKKRGHCEYFSTALAVALRVHGIPSREVVGFRGGELNEYGHYLAIRQSDAHTWVEALFPTYGWVKLDPSPSDSRFRFSIPRFQALYQFIDFLRLRWNKYIIEYDLRAQGKIFEELSKFLKGVGKGGIEKEEVTKPTDEDQKISPKVWGSILSILILLGTLVHLRKRKEIQLFIPILKAFNTILGKHGFIRRPSETLLEFKWRVERNLGEVKSMDSFVNFYYQLRFGGSNEKVNWEEKLKTLDAELKYKKQRLKRAA